MSTSGIRQYKILRDSPTEDRRMWVFEFGFHLQGISRLLKLINIIPPQDSITQQNEVLTDIELEIRTFLRETYSGGKDLLKKYCHETEKWISVIWDMANNADKGIECETAETELRVECVCGDFENENRGEWDFLVQYQSLAQARWVKLSVLFPEWDACDPLPVNRKILAQMIHVFLQKRYGGKKDLAKGADHQTGKAVVHVMDKLSDIVGYKRRGGEDLFFAVWNGYPTIPMTWEIMNTLAADVNGIALLEAFIKRTFGGSKKLVCRIANNKSIYSVDECCEKLLETVTAEKREDIAFKTNSERDSHVNSSSPAPAENTDSGFYGFTGPPDNILSFQQRNEHVPQADCRDTPLPRRVYPTHDDLNGCDELCCPSTESGWTMRSVCGLIEIWRVGNGVSKIALGKLLRIVGLVVDHKRHPSEFGIKFPDTKEKFFSVLKPILSHFNPKSTYLCATTKYEGDKCWGKMIMDEPTDVPAGQQPENLVCTECGITKKRSDLIKSNFYWTGVSLREITKDVLQRFKAGYRWYPPVRENGRNSIADVLNAGRIRKMNPHPDDLKIIVYADGAQVSKSSTVSCYLVYIQFLDLHPNLRESLMYLFAAYVHRDADSISSDRVFIMNELVRELRILDRNNPEIFDPIIWMDEAGREVKSGVRLAAVKGDSPELAALFGSEGSSAKEGCLLCYQVAKTKPRIHYPFLPDEQPALKTHREIEEIHDILKLCTSGNPYEFEHFKTTGQLKGLKRITPFAEAPGFDFVEGFIPDEMHTLFAGVGKRMGKYTFLYDTCIWAKSSHKTSKKDHFKSVMSRIEQRRAGVKVNGIFDRLLRQLKCLKQFKAHELEMNVIHIAPYSLHGLVLDLYWLPWKELSRMVDLCHKAEIYPEDLQKLDILTKSFLAAYTNAYGAENLVYVVHVASHMRLVVENYGQTYRVGCSDGENQNGRIIRANNASNETIAKSMVNNYYSGLSCKRDINEMLSGDLDSFPDVMVDIMIAATGWRNMGERSKSGPVNLSVTASFLELHASPFAVKQELLLFFPAAVPSADVWFAGRVNIHGRFCVRSAAGKQSKRNETWFFLEDDKTIIKVWKIATVGNITSTSQWYVICKSWATATSNGHLGIEHYYKILAKTTGKTQIVPLACLASQAIVLKDSPQENPDVCLSASVILSKENRLYRAK